MQALPTARPADPTKVRNFWDALGTEELTNWSKALASLAEKMFEATLRSGTYPLHAVHDEVFEFNVVIPLIQRYLFYRRIECEAQPFREKLACTQNPEKQKLLKEAHEKAIKARKKAIETIVKEDLAVKWKKEDKEEAEALAKYDRELSTYNKGLKEFENYREELKEYNKKIQEYAKEQPPLRSPPQKPVIPDNRKKEDTEGVEARAKYDREFSTYNSTLEGYKKYRKELEEYEKKTLELTKGKPPVKSLPPKPIKPIFRTSKEKSSQRLDVENSTIKSAQQSDTHLNGLKSIQLDLLDEPREWIRAQQNEFKGAMMGQFAQILDIPKTSLAYRLNGTDWIAKTFDDQSDDIWLMQRDQSLLFGSSPDRDHRFSGCKRTLEALPLKDANKITPLSMQRYLIGDNCLEDGFRLEKKDQDKGAKKREEKEIEEADKKRGEFNQKIRAHQEGFFNAGEGAQYLVPDEVAYIRKVDEMRKILSDPKYYLDPFNEGVFGSLFLDY